MSASIALAIVSLSDKLLRIAEPRLGKLRPTLTSVSQQT